MPSPLVLHAWVCDEYVGRFEKQALADRPTFRYDPSATQSISISMPLGGARSERAASNFIDALVPELPDHREILRRITGADSADPWDLLSAIGGDVAGGLTFSASENQPGEQTPLTNAASSEELAARILSTKSSGSAYTDFPGPVRFSLAGAQSKFAIAEMDGEFFWPDHATPSTVILKPESFKHQGLELIETATMELATRAGVQAARARQFTAGDETAYAVERFDREMLSGAVARRIHAEDMTQALGVSVGDKYMVGPDEIVEKLRVATGNNELGYAFYRQYAFNTIIGNADAHGKNYTLLYRGGAVEISPLYDAIPIGLFPELEQSLAMPVGYMDNFATIEPEHWIESAEDAGLNPDRVRQIVAEVSGGVLEHIDGTLGSVDHPRVTTDSLNEIKRAAEQQVQGKRTDLTVFMNGGPRDHSGGQTRRQDKGLGKTAGGGTGGSFT